VLRCDVQRNGRVATLLNFVTDFGWLAVVGDNFWLQICGLDVLFCLLLLVAGSRKKLGIRKIKPGLFMASSSCARGSNCAEDTKLNCGLSGEGSTFDRSF